MKKILIITLIILNLLIYIPTIAQSKILILSDKVFVIDPGHGGVDVGTSFGDIYEKNINLSISILLKKELENYGAKVYLTREGDYDLSAPNATFRKKSDFDNRIKIINNIKPTLFISIHQNNYEVSKYKGAQVFFKGLEKLANNIQNNINKERKIKKISNKLYMYNKLQTDGLLIECGFLSNSEDRKKLIEIDYQKELSKKIVQSIKDFYS